MWALGAARRVLVLGAVIRIPLWAASVVLTLHVVGHLHRSYAQAGLVVTAATIALAVGGPWRGRRVDRVGLRAAIAPCLAVGAGCWAVAPFMGYRALLGLASLAGLFAVPSFSIVRQALLCAVAPGQRRAALSADSVMVEVSFMIGPPLGVLLAAAVPTTWALVICESASIVGGLALWVSNPPLRDDAQHRAEHPQHADHPLLPMDAEATEPLPGTAGGRRVGVAAVLAMSAAAVLVLTGTDVAVVAALRSMGHSRWIGAELAVWGIGSAIGALVYGAAHRPVPVPALLGGLAVTTPVLALAPGPVTLGLLLVLAGLFCAPTITATVEYLAHAVPDHARGEALGRHAAAMTTGAAIGAPLAGGAIDQAGWRAGFVLPGLIGLAVATIAVLGTRTRHTDPGPVHDEDVSSVEVIEACT